MKIHYICVLSVFLLLSGLDDAKTQSLQPIPYENSGWTYVGWYIDSTTMLPDEEDVYSCYFDGDTSINAMTYHKFYFDGTHYSSSPSYSIGDHVYIGGMRNEGDSYYFLAKDSIAEVLIYDLSKSNIGDTLPLGYYAHLEYLIIEDTSTKVMEDGSLKKVLHLKHDWNPPYVQELYEGMGFITGLIPHELFSLYPCNGGHNFQSFCHYGTIVYHTVGGLLLPDECGYTVGVEQYEIFANELKAFPNPFTTTTIEYDLTEPSNVQLTIYNAIGEVVYKAEDRIMAVGKHSFTWSGDRLSRGLYYVVLRSEDGVSVVKMVKQ